MQHAQLLQQRRPARLAQASEAAHMDWTDKEFVLKEVAKDGHEMGIKIAWMDPPKPGSEGQRTTCGALGG